MLRTYKNIFAERVAPRRLLIFTYHISQIKLEKHKGARGARIQRRYDFGPFNF